MAYRNKTYICFDADNDILRYRLMQAWKANGNIEFDFHDAHDINNLMSYSSEETIKRKLRDRLKNSKLLVVLVGETTRNLYKFVRWEIETAIDLGIPIVAAYLDGSNKINTRICPPILREEKVLHVPYSLASLRYAIENWPYIHKNFSDGPACVPDNLFYRN